MIKLDRIVCPTDLSDDSERTIRYAVAITRASGAKLFVCYRPKTPVDWESAYAEDNEIDLIEMGAHGAGFRSLIWAS